MRRMSDNVRMAMRLARRLEKILALPEHVKRKRAIRFFTRHAPVLQKHLFQHVSKRLSVAFINLCNYLGEYAQLDMHYTEAVSWFEQSLLIMHHAPNLRKEFHTTYMYLGSCYRTLMKYHLAIYYFKAYQAYTNNPVVKRWCIEMIASMQNVQKSMRSIDEAKRNDRADYKQAIHMVQQAISITPHAPPWLHVNLASFYSACLRFDKAMEHLTIAFERGFNDWDRIFSDAHLQSLLSQDTFRKLFLKYSDVVFK